MSTQAPFTFPGLWPYIARAAAGRADAFLGRGRELWHYKQVQDALGQYPRLDPESRRTLLEHVAAVRDSLALTLDGVDLAVRESIEAVEGPSAKPEPEPKPEPAQAPAASASRRRRS